MQKRYRNCLKTAKAYPEADINSDHNLVVGEIKVRLKKVFLCISKPKELDTQGGGKGSNTENGIKAYLKNVLMKNGYK